MRGLVTSMLIVGAMCAAALADERAWQKLDEDRGIVVEGRAVEGSSLREVRVRADSVVEPRKLFETIWSVRDQAAWVPNLKELRVIRASDDENVVYERVKIPVIQDRDYVLKLTKRIDETKGIFEVIAVGASELGPAPTKGVVRMTNLRSRFTFEPRAGGGSRITYVSFGDPAGKVPAWIARAADVRGPKDFVRALIERAAR